MELLASRGTFLASAAAATAAGDGGRGGTAKLHPRPHLICFQHVRW